MFYLDTSVVVAAFTQEAMTEKSRQWIERTPVDDIFISSWVETEFAGAISFKLRTKQLQLEERASILSNWRTFVTQTAATIAISSEDFAAAENFAGQHKLALRAADALHLAVAQNAGCTLVTLDKQMARAAIEVGVPVANI
jgi:uncharacterized protein